MIPDQDDLLAVHETSQSFEEVDETGRIETVGFGAGEQASTLTVPAESQSGGYRSLAPVIAARSQDWRFPARRPRGADGRLLGEAGFVLEEDPGVLLQSVFFSSGQRTCFQYVTLSSSRSLACRAGFCTVQSMLPRIRQT